MVTPALTNRLPHLEALALASAEAQRRRRSHVALVTIAAVAFACAGVLARSTHAWIIAGAWAVAALVGHGWVGALDRGREGRMERAWAAWLGARTWYETSEALVIAFREHHPVPPHGSESVITARDLDELAQRLLADPLDAVDHDPVILAMAELMRVDFAERTKQLRASEVLRDAKVQATLIHDAARRVRDRLLNDALEDAEDLRAGRPPRHSARLDEVVPNDAPSPWSAPDLRTKMLRHAFEQAVVEASHGSVIESPAAGEILKRPGRWSPFAAPPHVMDLLLTLFDPTCAAIPPPPPERHDPRPTVR